MPADTKLNQKALDKIWEQFSFQLFQLEQEIKIRERKKAGVLSTLGGVLDSLDSIPSHWDVPQELRLRLDEKKTLGDAIEALIKDRGPMSQRDIIDALTEMRFPLNAKNPHVVVANAVKRDTRKRFRRLKDGKIALSSEGK